MYPAKFIYRTHPEMPTTEVAIRSNPREDLYVIMSTVDPRQPTRDVQDHRASRWSRGSGSAGSCLILGALIAIWPRAKDVLARQEMLKQVQGTAIEARRSPCSIALAMGFPANVEAQSDGTSSLHAGTVEIHDPEERRLFGHLLCQCGSCQRPCRSTVVACSWAEDRRAELRARLASNEPVDDIIASFRAQWGPAAIAIPADEGMDRALWAVPVAGFILAFGLIFFVGRRWKSGVREDDEEDDEGPDDPVGEADKDYDEALEDELKRLEEGL